MKKKKATDTNIDTYLESKGYMTSDEFVDRLVPGLKEYLSKNWGVHTKKELHHPETLISNASTYMEVAYHVFVDFGVTPQEDRN